MLQLAFDKGCTDQSYEDRSRNVFSTAYVRRPIPAASAFRFHSGEVYRTHEYFIDGVRVRSMADLRSRLYLLAPGTWVDLRVDRGRTVRTVGLWLGSSG